MDDTKVGTDNKFMVSSRGSMGVAIGSGRVTLPIANEDALNLAAWLVAVTGQEKRFKVVLEAILAT